MKVLQLSSIIVAIIITAAFPIGKNPSAEPNAAAEAEPNQEMPDSLAPSVETNLSSGGESSAFRPVLFIILSLWRTSTCKEAGGRCVGNL
jgi:hypothetical protein